MSQPIKDETGKRYGFWTVLSDIGNREDNNRCVKWLCKCDCGTIKLVNGHNLRAGISTSCGCKNHKLKEEGDAVGIV